MGQKTSLDKTRLLFYMLCTCLLGFNTENFDRTFISQNSQFLL